ncbi:MAG: hypothetical protein ACXV98_04890 [Ilumatobacteraceae bacterium]
MFVGIVTALVLALALPHALATTASAMAKPTAWARRRPEWPTQPRESLTSMLELEFSLMAATVKTARQLGIRATTQLCKLVIEAR